MHSLNKESMTTRCSNPKRKRKQHKRAPRGGFTGTIAHLKPAKVTLFTMILYNSENGIRDIRPFCRPFFCHSSVVKYISFLLQQRSRQETRLANNAEIGPLNLLAGSAPAYNNKTHRVKACKTPLKITKTARSNNKIVQLMADMRRLTEAESNSEISNINFGLHQGYSQGRNEVRQRPGQETSFASPCSNLSYFGSKSAVEESSYDMCQDCLALPAVVRCPHNDSAPGELRPPCHPLVTPLGLVGRERVPIPFSHFALKWV